MGTATSSATTTATTTATKTPEVILFSDADDSLAASTGEVQESSVAFCEEGDRNCGIVMSGIGLTFLLVIIGIIIFCCAKNKDGEVGPDPGLDQNVQTPASWVPHDLPTPAWPAMADNRSPPPRFDSMPQLQMMAMPTQQKSSMYRTPWADDSFAGTGQNSFATTQGQRSLRSFAASQGPSPAALAQQNS